MTSTGRLKAKTLLVVEDDYLVAQEMAQLLRASGAEVAGPVPSVDKALALIEATPQLDGAVLDVNLDGELVYAVADALLSRGVPFLFVTGYDRATIPARYARVGCCEKPVEIPALARALFG